MSTKNIYVEIHVILLLWLGPFGAKSTEILAKNAWDIIFNGKRGGGHVCPLMSGSS